MTKRRMFHAGAVFLTLSLVLLYDSVSVQAASPWHWDFAMRQDLLKDSMILPTALFVDQKKGQYYVVDSGKNRLVSFNRQGDLLNILNAGRSLDAPFDMVRTDDGVIWVVEKGRNSLTSIDLKARKVTPATLHYKGRLIYPDRLEYADGLFYVLDKGTGDIIAYDSAMVPHQYFSCTKCSLGFVDFKVYGKTLWALNRQQKKVDRFNLDGSHSGEVSLGEEVSLPVSLAVGSSGYLYVLDRHKRNIAVYDKAGTYKYSFLKHGFSRGKLYYPIEIRFDPWGGLCVTDEGNSRVEVFRR